MAEVVIQHRAEIPLFDGTNFNNWKFRVEIALEERGLLKYVENSLEDLLDGVTVEANQEKMKKEERQCKNFVVQNIHDSQLENIKEKKTAKEMFDTLANVFERKSIAGQLLVRRQLLTMKCDDSDDMKDHLLKFDRKIRELKSMGAKMEELDIVCNLLITLPKRYIPLVTAIETMDSDKITMDFVKSRLLDEHQKHNPNLSSEKSSTAAMNTSVTCYGCGQVGHIKSQCIKKKKYRGGNKNKFKKNDGSEKFSAHNTESKETKEHTSMVAYSYSASKEMTHQVCMDTHKACKAGEKQTNGTSQIKFILDSGATDHMVNNESYFHELKNIEKVNIGVAKRNMSLCANQRGDILVKTLFNGDCETRALRNVLLVKDLESNLLSIRNLTKHGYRVIFENDFAKVMRDGEIIFVAQDSGKLYEVNLYADQNAFAGMANRHCSDGFWHFRLGHLNVGDMKRLSEQNMVN